MKEDNNILIAYQEAIEQNLNLTDSNNIEEKWNETKEAILDAAKETLGEEKKERNGTWFDEECRDAIKKKKTRLEKTCLLETLESTRKPTIR